MAAIYLRHPLHGSKVACGEQEAEYDRGNGWVDYDPTAPAVPSFLAPSSDIPENFPARQFLIDGGVTKWSELVTKTETDLTAIKGIGPATAKEILEKLNS